MLRALAVLIPPLTRPPPTFQPGMACERIEDALRRLEAEKQSFVSFEFFPPKTEDGVKALVERIKRYQRQGGPPHRPHAPRCCAATRGP